MPIPAPPIRPESVAESDRATLGSSGAIDDCYVQHEKTIPPTTKSVKTEKIVGGMVSEIRYRLRSGGLFRSRAEYVSHDEIWPVWYPVMNHA